MRIRMRPLNDADWPAVGRLADEAAPWAGEMNAVWLAMRRAFDDEMRIRHHYVAVDERPAPVAYGAIEQDEEEPDSYRLFAVMPPELLDRGPGDIVMSQLLDDLRELAATKVWMREEARDTAVLGFARRHGFEEVQRFVHDGIAIVLLELDLG